MGRIATLGDARNHLVSISGGVSAAFEYDAVGRRASKTASGNTTQFLYDGLNPVQELDGASPPNQTANLLTGLGIDEYFQRTDSVNGSLTYLTDILHSTLALASPSSSLVALYAYDPFGNATVTGAPVTNPYEFTGRENDGTGLYFYRARYYSPALQRFISQDPLGFGGGDVNLYQLVYANPVNLTDQMGLSYLVFYPREHDLDLYDSEGNLIAQYTAYNNVTSGHQPFPEGDFGYSHDMSHDPDDPLYKGVGPHGFYFNVHGDEAMGVHGARRGPSSPTHGCIRTSDDAIQDIIGKTLLGPLTDIVVTPVKRNHR
jgi:RHS repeat-associated protein